MRAVARQCVINEQVGCSSLAVRNIHRPATDATVVRSA